MTTSSQSAGLAAPRVPPIDSAITELSAAQSETHDLISALFNRLESVLPHPSDSLKPGSDPQPAPAGESPLHGWLLERIEFARGQNHRLMKILDELTL